MSRSTFILACLAIKTDSARRFPAKAAVVRSALA
jgi:hypothetical protein